MSDTEERGRARIKVTTAVDQNVEQGDNEKSESSPSRPAEALVDPFGDESDAHVKYRTLTWWQCGMIMIAETISLGILSLPSAMATLGLVPGLIILVGLGILATYTGYLYGEFKAHNPGVHNMGDAGQILAGPIGREVMGAAQLLFLIFIMASHILTFSVMLNVLTGHATCSIAWGVLGMVISIILTLPRTLLKVSGLSIISFISIVAAVTICMVSIGIDAPSSGKVDLTRKTTLHQGFLAVSNMIFAYAGHVAFFGFMAELKDPVSYPKALFLLQGVDTTMYILTATIIYYYGGKHVTSPALGSTSSLIQKISYGIAAPTIVIAGVINGHVAVKYVFIRLFRGSPRVGKKDRMTTGVWVLIIIVLWGLAWIIAEAIPNFNHLLGLITSLFASWFTYGIGGAFWLHIHRGKWFSNWRKSCLCILNFSVLALGGIVCALGLYASGKSIHQSPPGTSFSCANNAV